MSKKVDKERIYLAVSDFIHWLDSYGEDSQDHQDFFSNSFGRFAKSMYYKRPILGKLLVSPMVLCEAFFPYTRRLFYHRQRLPIADAHFAMGFAFLSQYTDDEKYFRKSLHFLDILQKTRCPDYGHYCWGYPFHWMTRNGCVYKNTPLITTTPYCYEAFEMVYEIDKRESWYKIMHSIAEHAVQDIHDSKTSPKASTCSYTPYDKGGVINANAYRAYLLTNASLRFTKRSYWDIAERNLHFVLESQLPNGSWPYALDGQRDFIDHFHTCFVLKALAKIDRLIDHQECQKAIQKGVEYYLGNLIDHRGLPKPFAKAPRLTVYKQELYDYAECLNLCILLMAKFGEFARILLNVLDDCLNRWQKPGGSFRSRKLALGWDNVPMHRWGQAQLFRSLCFLLYNQISKARNCVAFADNLILEKERR